METKINGFREIFEVLKSNTEIKNGDYKKYNRAGELVIEGRFNKNVKVGLWKFYESGTIEQIYDFDLRRVIEFSANDLYYETATENGFERLEIDRPPLFIGGRVGLEEELNIVMSYPSKGLALGIEGRIYVDLIIDQNDQLSLVQVLRGIDVFDEEITNGFRQIKEGWMSGIKDDRKRLTRWLIPVRFQLHPNGDQTITIPIEEVPAREIEEEIFTIVEEQPQFPGGMKMFYEFIGSRITYPVLARRLGVEGRVYVEFIVSEDGSISRVQAVKGIGAGCDEEAVRVMQMLPKFSPGRQRGRAVKVKMVLPIYFKLAESTKSFTSEKLGFPQFRTGHIGLEKFISENKRSIDSPLPPNNLNDFVHLKIKFTEEGVIEDVEIEEGLSEPFNEEAIRLFKSMPPWYPAMKDGVAVEGVRHFSLSFSNLDSKDSAKTDSYYEKAYDAIDKGRLEDALKFLNKAIELNPTKLNYYFDRAMVFIELNDVDSACEDLSIIHDYDEEAAKYYGKYCQQK